MCSETDFTQEKGNFHPTTRIPNSYCSAAGPQPGGTLVPPDDYLQPRKEHDKCIFETLLNGLKCVLSIKEFSHLLTVRAATAAPPHPPFTVIVTVKYPFFYGFQLIVCKKTLNFTSLISTYTQFKIPER